MEEKKTSVTPPFTADLAHSSLPVLPLDPIMGLVKDAKRLHALKEQGDPVEESVDRKDDLSQPKPLYLQCIGKPTYPMPRELTMAALTYWQSYQENPSEVGTTSGDGVERRASVSRDVLTQWMKAGGVSHAVVEGADTKREVRSVALVPSKAIGYGEVQGNQVYRTKIATAMTKWYRTEVLPEHILFTVGGAAAIHISLRMVRERFPAPGILTPFPHYGLYEGLKHENQLFPIPVMTQRGYQLTAALFEACLKNYAPQISAFLLCNPNNPLGTVVSKKEFQGIVKILQKEAYQHIVLIVDEAYEEMRFDAQTHGFHETPLSMAPDLKERMIVMRSATKGFSAAGERLAFMMVFNPALMSDLIAINVNLYGHAPLSSQAILAEVLEKFSPNHVFLLTRFYEKQVRYVQDRLNQMAARMPDTAYQVRGTFYVLCHLEDLLGLPFPPRLQAFLGTAQEVIETDRDIVYYLIEKADLVFAPLSFFGGEEQEGFLRITCSTETEKELEAIMDRLEKCLVEARQFHKEKWLSHVKELDETIRGHLQRLRGTSKGKKEVAEWLENEFNHIQGARFYPQERRSSSVFKQLAPSAAQLKKGNQLLYAQVEALKSLLEEMQTRECLSELSGEDNGEKEKAAVLFQSFFRAKCVQQECLKEQALQKEYWHQFCTQRLFRPCTAPEKNSGVQTEKQDLGWKSVLFKLTPSQRREIIGWNPYLSSLTPKK